MDQTTVAFAGVLVGGGIGILTSLATAAYNARAQRRLFLLTTRRHDYREFFLRINRLITNQAEDNEAMFDAFSRVDSLVDERHVRLLEQFRDVLDQFFSAKDDNAKGQIRGKLLPLYAEVKKTLRGEILSKA